LAKIEEEEAWVSEKQQLLTVPDLGENMAAVQGLLKKHDAFETDLSVHNDKVNSSRYFDLTKFFHLLFLYFMIFFCLLK